MLLQNTKIFNATVIVAALGYFVDIFDLVLFGMVRIPSLKSLGITDAVLLQQYGLMLDNWQMGGMLLGGIVWGILGDKKGRLTVLFGSIITYSLANIANGMVHDVSWYAFFRFLAGFGLAGELGAGITLVNETMVKEKRGLATAFVAATGIFGAVAGAVIVRGIDDLCIHFNWFVESGTWRMTYFVGGAMGIVLLILRISVRESGMYQEAQLQSKQLGNISVLFKSPKIFLRYLSIIALAVPIWYAVQLYAKYSPELADAVGLQFQNRDDIARKAIMYIYLGLTFGDLASGLVSNALKSRKKALLLFLIMLVAGLILFWTVGIKSTNAFYVCVFLMGIATGYWAVFMSTAAESFGTNIRSTVTNTSPNFVRASVIPINLAYSFLGVSLGLGALKANIIIGVVVLGMAFLSLRFLKETFHQDLNYLEQ